jgi:hypothetical protein
VTVDLGAVPLETIVGEVRARGFDVCSSDAIRELMARAELAEACGRLAVQRLIERETELEATADKVREAVSVGLDAMDRGWRAEAEIDTLARERDRALTAYADVEREADS